MPLTCSGRASFPSTPLIFKGADQKNLLVVSDLTCNRRANRHYLRRFPAPLRSQSLLPTLCDSQIRKFSHGMFSSPMSRSIAALALGGTEIALYPARSTSADFQAPQGNQNLGVRTYSSLLFLYTANVSFRPPHALASTGSPSRTAQPGQKRGGSTNGGGSEERGSTSMRFQIALRTS